MPENLLVSIKTCQKLKIENNIGSTQLILYYSISNVVTIKSNTINYEYP